MYVKRHAVVRDGNRYGGRCAKSLLQSSSSELHTNGRRRTSGTGTGWERVTNLYSYPSRVWASLYGADAHISPTTCLEPLNERGGGNHRRKAPGGTTSDRGSLALLGLSADRNPAITSGLEAAQQLLTKSRTPM